MKTKIILTLIFMITCAYLYFAFIRRNPNKILKQQFDFQLNDFDYSVKSFSEQWDDNGDGYCKIIIQFNYFTAHNNNYLEKMKISPLPIFDKISSNEIPWKFLNSKTGYYLYNPTSIDKRSFKIFIIDIKSKEAIFYYQIE